MLDFEKGNTREMTLVLELANQIGAKTVIEGIETQQQLVAMQSLGFDMYQGYHLAMPEPIELDIRLAI